MESLKTVVQGVAVRLVVSRDYLLSMCMRLRYEPTDPYVIHAAFFTAESDEPVEWALGRDLLADGLRGSVGEGDVRIWSAVGHGDQAMYIALRSSAGTALLEVPVQDVKTFLQNTEALVPQGTESRCIEWDTELANLLTEN
ncbi:SsgA family sporulation/cell division regulator [Streptomyces sp. NPDC057062]|uniref:SsgA family sporulation/cell division regulator n=1 Tax=Streptomyces sp. NPDC057062 TaxID=3346011 RepID=UPI00362AF3D5